MSSSNSSNLNFTSNKTQTKLLNFFSVEKDDSKGVICSGCGDTFPCSKINWHKDFDCIVILKDLRDNSYSVSRKKIKKKVERKRKASKVIKSGSKNNNKEIINISDSDSDNIFSSVKTATNNEREASPTIFELEENKNTDEPTRVKSERLVETLKKDWDTPEKIDHEENQSNIDSYNSSISEYQLPMNEKTTSNNQKLNISFESSDYSLLSSNNSGDEFEKDVLVFNNSKRKCKPKTKIITSKPPKQSLKDNILPLNTQNSESMCDNNSISSYEGTPLKSPTIVSPIRTPSPSPTHLSPQKRSNLKISPNIYNTPSKFFHKNSDKFSNSEISTSENTKEIITDLSQLSSSQKNTPHHIFKSLQKTSLQNGYIPVSAVKVRRNIFASNNVSPFKSSKPSPSKYRKEKGMYLDNFCHIIGTVTDQPQDHQLLNTEDLNVIKSFNSFSLEAQKLYVRLFQRKIKWNKVSKIEYKEICDKEDMQLYINELIYADFLIAESSLKELKEYLPLLDLNEVKKLSKLMNSSGAGSKATLISRLLKSERTQKTVKSFFKSENNDSNLLKMTKELVGKCFILNKEPWRVFMRILQLYSPVRFDEDEENGQQAQLTMLLMVSIGKMKFPPYKIIRQNSIYRSRDDLIMCQTCLLLEYEIQDCIRKQEWDNAINLCKQANEIISDFEKNPEVLAHDISLPPHLRRYTTMSLIHHIRSLVVEIYERQKHYEKAVKELEKLLSQKIYLQDYRGKWYDRMALNLHPHLKRVKKCMEVIKEALEDPEVRVGHRLSLSQRAEKLMSSKMTQKIAAEYEGKLNIVNFQEAPKMYIQGKSLPSDIPGYKRVFLSTENDDGNTICSVEELVLAHYRKEGYPKGLHCEGRTIAALFGFFMWDILYLSIPDAFRSPQQAAPLDLNFPDFYKSRKQEIDKRIEKMSSWKLKKANKIVGKIWEEYEDVICLIDWKIFSSLEFLQGLIAGLGLKLISTICKRMATDHRFTRSGFPDLIVWNPHEKTSRIVEVKGPNDKLSTKQILWLDYLLENGAAAEVCHVEAVGTKRTGALKSRRDFKRKKDTDESQLPSDTSSHKTENITQPINRRSKRKRVS